MPPKSKYNCGDILGSACVPFTGQDLTFLSEADIELFPCNANMDDVIFYIDKYLADLVESNDFTDLDKDCLDFDPATVTAKELHQIEITEICLLKGQVLALNELIENLNIGSEQITIDLECLTPDAEPCEVSDNVYTLQTILEVFVAKICEFETRISNLES